MSRGLYIATNSISTGKRMVALGIMDLVTRYFERPLFFRPIIRTEPEHDQSLQLMCSRYRFTAEPNQLFGVTRKQARELIAADGYQQLIQTIQSRFKECEDQSDFVVVEGTSYQGLVPELEFELNTDIAVNIGCPLLPVYAAPIETPQDTDARTEAQCDEFVQSVQIGNDAIAERGGEILSTIVNKMSHALAELLPKRCTEAGLNRHYPMYFLPDIPLLRQPTVREIQKGIGASVLVPGANLDREISQLLVAAMQLPSFLERLSDASCIITPGDRIDILAGCCLASLRPEGPAPVAMVLTAGIVPSPPISQLAALASNLTILSTPDDTFTTAQKAATVRAEISRETPRKIETALGLFAQHVDLDEIARRLKAPSPKRVTPLLFEYSLIERARAKRVKIVLPEGSEPRILQAVDILRRRNAVDLILLGDPGQIASAALHAGVNLPSDGVEIIDPRTSHLRYEFAEKYYELRRSKGITQDAALDRMLEVNYFGTMLVHTRLADGMVSGAIHATSDTIRPAFEVIRTQPGVRSVSSVFLMCMHSGVLVFGDCAVIPNPDSQQLAEIAIRSAQTAVAFGIEPRIAMLSYSTGQSGSGEDVNRVREATQLVRTLRPDLPIEGPIQYDAAIDPAVAATKLPESKTAGHATVLIFPDLNTGNNTYKAVQRSAGALAIGPILQGLNRPVNDLSRGCTVADIVNTVAITAIQAQPG